MYACVFVHVHNYDYLFHLHFHAISDRVQQVGNEIVESDSGVDTGAPVIFLLNDAVFKKGILFAFAAYFRVSTVTHLQVWRPVNNGTVDSLNFTLVSETIVTPALVADQPSRQNVTIYVFLLLLLLLFFKTSLFVGFISINCVFYNPVQTTAPYT